MIFDLTIDKLFVSKCPFCGIELQEAIKIIHIFPLAHGESGVRMIDGICELQDRYKNNRIQPEDIRVQYLMDRGFPFVTHGRTVWSDRHAYYEYDNRAFGGMAVREMARRGHRRVLMIAPPRDQNYAAEMIAGGKAAARETSIDLIVADGVTCDDHRDKVESYVAEKLRKDKDITGIVSASPNATMSAVAGLEAAGRKIGEGFDIYSKETIPFLTLFRPGILCAHEDVAKAGANLARAALHALQHPDEPPMQFLDVPEE